MKKYILTGILSLFLIAASSYAIYFGLKSHKLQEVLETTQIQQDQIASQIAAQAELMSIDSMLIDGKYKKALKAYEEVEIDQEPSIEMRVALAKELLRLRYENQLAEIRAQQHLESDSLPEQTAFSELNIRQQDSLGFALEKAKVKLAYLQRQLAEKSFGEYLKFTNSKGSQMHYVGQVKDGKANGYGVALLNTGSRYEGEWKNNQRHGKGTYYWSDGQYYVGDYKSDKRNGQGTYYWPNGEKYAGQWEDDERDGKGVFYGKDGKIVADGTWEDDKLAENSSPRRTKTGGK